MSYNKIHNDAHAIHTQHSFLSYQYIIYRHLIIYEAGQIKEVLIRKSFEFATKLLKPDFW